MERLSFIVGTFIQFGKTVISDSDMLLLVAAGLLAGRKGFAYAVFLWFLARRGDQYVQVFATKLDKIATLRNSSSIYTSYGGDGYVYPHDSSGR